MSYDLQVLTDHRETILLAELAALLHNLGKLDPNFLPNQVSDTSSAIRQIQARGQFVNGYQFKRFADSSANLLSKAQSIIASPTRLDPTSLPSVAPGDFGLAQIRAAVSFNRFFRGTGVLDAAETSRLQALQLVVGGESWTLPDMLTLFWDGEFIYKASGDDYQRHYALAYWLTQSDAVLPLLLALAHGEMSGSEKYRLVDDPTTGNPVAEGIRQHKTTFNQLRISTAFGFETDQPVDVWCFQSLKRGLIASLPTTAQDVVKQRSEWLVNIREALAQGLGDTQWPVNEITLWDYASSIAALFKASIAKSILEGKAADANQMHWRLLGLRLDGLDYLFQANRVADVIARNEVLKTALDAARAALEYRTPLGNEVYRDEHGSFFVVPELDGMTLDELKAQIEAVIEDAITATHIDDIWPHISFSEKPLRGKQLNLGAEMQCLGMPRPSDIRATTMAAWWREAHDICPVCQVRPQGFVPGHMEEQSISPRTAKRRKVCGVCLARRQGSRQTLG